MIIGVLPLPATEKVSGVGTVADIMRVGWVGTGVMGRYMCEHLMKKGPVEKTTVFTRTPSKAQPLVDLGAVLAGSAKEVAENSDIVFSIVGYPKDVEEVILGANGVLAGLGNGGIVVDCTTSRPSLASHIYQQAKAKGLASLDAPVSGGDVGARNGTLSFMVGGDKEAFEKVKPYLQTMGAAITHCGGPGQGQHTKMVNQILVSTMMIGVCEGLLYSHRAGLDMETVMKAVSVGAAGSWSLSNYGPRILRRDFDPGFFVEHFVKDMEIALQEASAMNLSLPGLALANQLYISLKAQGRGRLGTQSLVLALEQLNGIQS